MFSTGLRQVTKQQLF